MFVIIIVIIAGHVMTYRNAIRLDTALAERTLSTMDDNGAVVSPNLVEGRFVHFSTDNVDINEATLDGKVSHHVTSSMKHVNELLRTCCLVKSTSHSNVLGVVILSPLAV
jgi:glutamate-1-semialdehyde aminotransferase